MLSDKDYIIECIRDYASEYIKDPRWGLPRGLFERRSYSKAAIEEIIREIRKSDAPPITAVENFMQKMYRYTVLKNRKMVMFSIAYDEAEQVLDFLLAMKGEK